MKIDFSRAFHGLDDKPLLKEDETTWTLRDVATMALLRDTREEAERTPLPAEQKFKLGLLAEKITKAEEPLDITVEEAALLKRRIGDIFTTLFVMLAWRMLEGEA